MRFVVFYTPSPDGFANAPSVYPRHRAYVDTFVARGGIVGIGTFDRPETNGAMCVFSSRAAADDFLAGDPFLLEGVVTAGGILEWDPLTFHEVAQTGFFA